MIKIGDQVVIVDKEGYDGLTGTVEGLMKDTDMRYSDELEEYVCSGEQLVVVRYDDLFLGCGIFKIDNVQVR